MCYIKESINDLFRMVSLIYKCIYVYEDVCVF